jgi:hypothetical protein
MKRAWWQNLDINALEIAKALWEKNRMKTFPAAAQAFQYAFKSICIHRAGKVLWYVSHRRGEHRRSNPAASKGL